MLTPKIMLVSNLPIFNTENIDSITGPWCTCGIPVFELSFEIRKFEITGPIWTSFSFLPLKSISDTAILKILYLEKIDEFGSFTSKPIRL